MSKIYFCFLRKKLCVSKTIFAFVIFAGIFLHVGILVCAFWKCICVLPQSAFGTSEVYYFSLKINSCIGSQARWIFALWNCSLEFGKSIPAISSGFCDARVHFFPSKIYFLLPKKHCSHEGILFHFLNILFLLRMNILFLQWRKNTSLHFGIAPLQFLHILLFFFVFFEKNIFLFFEITNHVFFYPPFSNSKQRKLGKSNLVFPKLQSISRATQYAHMTHQPKDILCLLKNLPLKLLGVFLGWRANADKTLLADWTPSAIPSCHCKLPLQKVVGGRRGGAVAWSGRGTIAGIIGIPHEVGAPLRSRCTSGAAGTEEALPGDCPGSQTHQTSLCVLLRFQSAAFSARILLTGLFEIINVSSFPLGGPCVDHVHGSGERILVW